MSPDPVPETAEPEPAPAAPAPGAPAPASPAKAPRWRRILVAVLVVISVLLAPLTVMTIWLHNKVLSTSGYVQTVAPLATNQAIINAVANSVSTSLYNSLDVEAKAKDALPPKAEFLAGPIAGALNTFTHEATLKILNSSAFPKIWNEVNRVAHQQIVYALTGGGKVISTTNGKISLDLTALTQQVIIALDQRGITIFDNVPAVKVARRLELFDAPNLSKAQTGFRILNKAWVVFLVLMFALLGIATWLSPRPRRTIIRWGLGVAFAMGVTALCLALGRYVYLNATVGPNAPRDAAKAAFDIMVRFLRNGIRLMALGGLLVAFVAWVTGPTPRAVRLREGSVATVDRVRGNRVAAGWDFGGFGAWVGAHRPVLRYSGIGLALLILLFWDQPRPLTVLVLVLLVLVYLAAIEFVGAAAAPSPSPAAPNGEG